MSADALPISPARFAEALTSLPLGNLFLKAAELRNSIAHLQSSNDQLKPYADEGDRDCAEAITENVEVIGRMEERIRLLKAEVEGRGAKWDEDADVGTNGKKEEEGGDEDEDDEMEEVNGHVETNGTGTTERPRLTDEELARRLRERMDEDMGDDDNDGVHL